MLINQNKDEQERIPGNFPGLHSGTNFAPIAKAIEGPNINPLASTPIMKESSILKT